jgi:aryl-phospho-beta-D-glucosidase BglC (GH1 family)
MKARFSRYLAVVASSLYVQACGGQGTADRGSAPGPIGPMSDPNSILVPTWEPEPLDPASPVGLHGALGVEGGFLVDAAGVPVQLKGVSTMWLNWEQTYASSKEGLRWLRDNWGLSVVRAAMGVEPMGGYLQSPSGMTAQVRSVVQNAIDVGVYVIIDWHDHNAQIHQDQANSFFAEMAEEFGEYPNVLYETYNEPTRVDWTEVVKPYHVRATATIRERDADNVIILGTPFWSQQVDEASLDPVAGTNLMYTVHFYSCSHAAQQRQQAMVAADRGVAIFVTEWGATEADGGTDPNGMLCLEEAQRWHDFMDERQISWAAWKLDDCPDLSCLFRPQAPRIGGWTEDWLQGHGPFVRERMLAQ